MEMEMTDEEYYLNCLRRIETDGTVTARKYYNTRGWTELNVAMQAEVDRQGVERVGESYSTFLHGLQTSLLGKVGGWFCGDSGKLRFSGPEAWQRWADLYERFDSSLMLPCTIDNQEHNPSFWQKFINSVPRPAGTHNDYMVWENSIRRELRRSWDAEIKHDGRYEMVHWRVDFPSKEYLAAFKLSWL